MSDKSILIMAVLITFFSCMVAADLTGEAICRVEGGDDLFYSDPNQLVYSSDMFSIYQLIDGLTVLIINKKTRRFNRLSNLNLLAHSTLDPSKPAEPLQYFTGLCEYSIPEK